MRICTIVWDKGREVVEICDHKTWTDLIKDGWNFYATKGPHVLMVRNGRINEFWAEED